MSATLVFDEPRWPMPSLTAEPSLRRLRVWRQPTGQHLAFITERGPGTSVTNVAEHAWAAVQRMFPGARVFEHYPAEAGVDGREHFDEIGFDHGRLQWVPWPPAVVAEWVGLEAVETPFDDPQGRGEDGT